MVISPSDTATATLQRGREALPLVLGVVASVVVGIGMTRGQSLVSLAAGLALFLAAVVLVLSVQPEILFIGWLTFAPFVQEPSHVSSIGDDLNHVLYRLPPLVLILATAMKRSKHQMTFIDVMPALYLLYVFVSMRLISSQPESIGAELRPVYVTIALGIVTYYFLLLGPTTSRLEERIAWSLIGSGIVIALMTILEGFTGWNLWHDTAWGYLDPPRAVATLANPATLGTFLGMVIAFALAILIWDGPKPLRKLSALFLILAFPALFLTYTRGPMIAVAAISLLMIFLRSKSAWPGFVVLILVVTIFAANWNEISSSSVYRSRLGVTNTAETRLELQRVSIKLAKERPIAGWGFGSFDRVKGTSDTTSSHIDAAAAARANTSHDTFLTILVELGPLGLLVLLAPWLIVGWRAIKAARRASPHRWILVATLGALGIYIVSAGTLDMRFFSFVPAMAWLAVGLARRTVSDSRDAL